MYMYIAIKRKWLPLASPVVKVNKDVYMYIATKTKWPPLASPVVKVMFRSDVL